MGQSHSILSSCCSRHFFVWSGVVFVCLFLGCREESCVSSTAVFPTPARSCSTTNNGAWLLPSECPVPVQGWLAWTGWFEEQRLRNASFSCFVDDLVMPTKVLVDPVLSIPEADLTSSYEQQAQEV